MRVRKAAAEMGHEKQERTVGNEPN